jgi:hypothetical protein
MRFSIPSKVKTYNEQQRWRLRMLGMYGTFICCSYLFNTEVYQVSEMRFPCLCLFKTLLGIDCPVCGITRSTNAALHFHFIDSMRFHPLGLPIIVFLIFVSVYLSFSLILKNTIQVSWNVEVRISSICDKTLFMVLVGRWLLKFFV